MKILFHGDSITDAERSREYDSKIGCGYPLLVKASLGLEEPGTYEFINRGISGNRVVDIYARIKSDIINLKPDVMSILVGVNDVCHEFMESPNGVGNEKYFMLYDMLINEVSEALPNIKIMIMEPFVLRVANHDENWDELDYEVRKRASMARKIAEKHNLPFIALQEGFNKLSKKAPTDYWIRDGIHPTPMGHEFIKNEWIKAFRNLQ